MHTIGQMFCLKLTKNSLNKLEAYVQVSSTKNGKELGLNEHIYLFSSWPRGKKEIHSTPRI